MFVQLWYGKLPILRLSSAADKSGEPQKKSACVAGLAAKVSHDEEADKADVMKLRPERAKTRALAAALSKASSPGVGGCMASYQIDKVLWLIFVCCSSTRLRP